MLCCQMGAIVAVQSTFHFSCITHTFPLWEKYSSMISLSVPCSSFVPVLEHKKYGYLIR